MSRSPHIGVASAMATMLDEAIEGPVWRPGDDGYDAARLPWQRAVDPFPALIAEAARPADVAAAVRIARGHDLPLAVQSTGHGAVLSYEGGLLIRTTALNAVEIDPDRRTARVGAGATWGEVVAAAARYGLAPLSGSSPTVGVVGYTLGGGAGWLSRAHGFAADSVLRAEVVTAEGTVLTADADRHPDLFWALRGGGGNLAVVTSLEFRLYPVTTVYAGMVMFDIEHAGQVLARYRDWAPEEPDESSTGLVLTALPPAPELPESVRGRRVLGLRMFYKGAAEDAERVLAPLRKAAGEPLMDGLRPMSYADSALAFGPPPGPGAIVNRFELVRDIPDEMIQDLVALAEAPHDARPVRPAGIEVRHWGGAMGRPPADAGPIGHRDVPFSVVIGGQAPATPEGIAAHRAAIDEAADRLRPYVTGGSFLNFLSDPARTASAYTPDDHQRLTAVKKSYDPDNVLCRNLNIAPEDPLTSTKVEVAG